MPNENTLALEKPNPVTVPDIGKPLIEVFKAGGMPLAFLFIVATIIGWLLTRGFADQALSTILVILKWMLAGSFVSFIVLATLGYLKWREELKARLEEHRLNMDEYLERYRGESNLQEKFIVVVSQQAAEIASAHPNWGPVDYENGVKALSNAVENLLPKMMEMRAKMQQLPAHVPPIKNGS